MYNTDSTELIYKGYYCKKHNDILLCVSSSKEIVKNYLINHRNLSKGEYFIEKEDVSDIDLVTKYDDYLMSEYYGYFIPAIDQVIIEMNSKSIEEILSNTMESIKYIITISDSIKSIERYEMSNLLNCYKTLNNFKINHKKLKKLENKHIKTDEFFFVDIDEYLKSINSFKELRDMNTRYKYALYD